MALVIEITHVHRDDGARDAPGLGTPADVIAHLETPFHARPLADLKENRPKSLPIKRKQLFLA